MPPNATSNVPITGVLNENDAETNDGGLAFKENPETVNIPQTQEKFKTVLVWRNIILFFYLHVAGFYGLYLMLTSAKLYTAAFGR